MTASETPLHFGDVEPVLLEQAPERAYEAARLARSLAPSLCAPAADAGHGPVGGCRWYHALYPALRALRLAASPDRHADFFAQAFGEAARGGDVSRVLVTGTADSGILEHLLRAWWEARAPAPEVDALDLCETPLRLCVAYGRAVGVPVGIQPADVLAFEAAQPYDLVCTHSFVVKFGPEARPALFARWASLLRPGGRVVSTVRIAEDDGAAATGHTAAQAGAFEARVLARAEPLLPSLGVSRDVLAAELAVHAREVRSVPVPSEAALRSLLEHAGFGLSHLELRERGNASAAQGGAGVERRACYADFVAVRR